ncbi:MAG: bifunctional phosphoribosylaminoimidazolecarboxamide formyltransferase/IMP cyclohydrolase, partial [Chloroflexota bacterium]
MRALISVFHKTGIAELATQLAGLGVELVSSGGTAATLRAAGLSVLDVASVTHFPEILDGRVKTLHPAIHAGILARRDSQEHMATLEEHGIVAIDLVVSDLYPFRADPSIEQIDIGGVSLIRAAAKNREFVAVVVDRADYEPVLAEIKLYGAVTEPTRRRLAAVAFGLTANYDAHIAAWLNRQEERLLPAHLAVPLERTRELRYGENPHQQAAFYTLERPGAGYPSIAGLKQLHGPELGFNNLLDVDAAIQAASAFSEPTIALIKHGNPCGLATRPRLLDAYREAWAGDPASAYGGILGSNRRLDLETVVAMAKSFVEVMVAPGYAPDALERLAKRARTRVLEAPGDWAEQPSPYQDLDLRRVRGGVLVQTLDFDSPELGFQVATRAQPSAEQRRDLLFAWKAIRHVKSNAIVLVRDCALLAVGAGQQSRVGAVQIAISKAGERSQGAVLA